MNGEGMPARPMAPTPFKKSRRTILLGPGRNVREAEIGAILVFDLKEVTEDDVSLGFMLMIFRHFLVGARSNLDVFGASQDPEARRTRVTPRYGLALADLPRPDYL